MESFTLQLMEELTHPTGFTPNQFPCPLLWFNLLIDGINEFIDRYCSLSANLKRENMCGSPDEWARGPIWNCRIESTACKSERLSTSWWKIAKYWLLILSKAGPAHNVTPKNKRSPLQRESSTMAQKLEDKPILKIASKSKLNLFPNCRNLDFCYWKC